MRDDWVPFSWAILWEAGPPGKFEGRAPDPHFNLALSQAACPTAKQKEGRVEKKHTPPVKGGGRDTQHDIEHNILQEESLSETLSTILAQQSVMVVATAAKKIQENSAAELEDSKKMLA
eukprot:3377017-Rhodomonas_salina.1